MSTEKTQKHLLLFDVDGTLTPKSGGSTVFTKEYDAVTKEIALAAISTEPAEKFLRKKMLDEFTVDESQREQLWEQYKEEYKGVFHAAGYDDNALARLDSEDVFDEDFKDPDGSLANGWFKRSSDFNKQQKADFEAALNAKQPGELQQEFETKLQEKIEAKERLSDTERYYQGYYMPTSSPYNLMQVYPREQDLLTRANAIKQKIASDHPNERLFSIDAAGIQLIKEALQNNCDVHMVSKNHEDYIAALLLHNGLTEAELSQLVIHDVSNGGGHKRNTVTTIIEPILRDEEAELASVSFFDDDSKRNGDYFQMQTGISKACRDMGAPLEINSKNVDTPETATEIKQQQIVGCTMPAGQFSEAFKLVSSALHEKGIFKENGQDLTSGTSATTTARVQSWRTTPKPESSASIEPPEPPKKGFGNH